MAKSIGLETEGGKERNNMKNPKVGDYLLWLGEPAKIIKITHNDIASIKLLESRRCPHCKRDLGNKIIHMKIYSLLFQRCAIKMPTIEEDNL